jgi:hypothetical protein
MHMDECLQVLETSQLRRYFRAPLVLRMTRGGTYMAVALVTATSDINTWLMIIKA